MLFLELLKNSDFLSHILFQGIVYFFSWMEKKLQISFVEWKILKRVLCSHLFWCILPTRNSERRERSRCSHLGIDLIPVGMWGCVKTVRNQQCCVRGSSRDGKKTIWENTNGSLAGMCPSLSIVFPTLLGTSSCWGVAFLSSACICLEQIIPVEPGGKSVGFPHQRGVLQHGLVCPRLSLVPGGAKVQGDSWQSCVEWWGGQVKILGAFWSLWSDWQNWKISSFWRHDFNTKKKCKAFWIFLRLIYLWFILSGPVQGWERILKFKPRILGINLNGVCSQLPQKWRASPFLR